IDRFVVPHVRASARESCPLSPRTNSILTRGTDSPCADHERRGKERKGRRGRSRRPPSSSSTPPGLEPGIREPKSPVLPITPRGIRPQPTMGPDTLRAFVSCPGGRGSRLQRGSSLVNKLARTIRAFVVVLRRENLERARDRPELLGLRILDLQDAAN